MNWHRRILRGGMSCVAAMLIAAGATSVKAADMGAVDEPIKLAMNEWTGQHISAHRSPARSCSA